MIHVHGIGNYHHRMSVKEANWMLLQISKCAQRPNIWHAYYYCTNKKQKPNVINIGKFRHLAHECFSYEIYII